MKKLFFFTFLLSLSIVSAQRGGGRFGGSAQMDPAKAPKIGRYMVPLLILFLEFQFPMHQFQL